MEDTGGRTGHSEVVPVWVIGLFGCVYLVG